MISKNKKRVLITLPKEKLRELRVKAAQADLTLSKYLVKKGLNG